MKILLVSELVPFNMIGGLARHCITLGNHLLETGHEVHLMGNADFPIGNSMDFKGRFIPGFRLNWSLAETIEKRLGIFPYPLYLRFSRKIADAINKIAGHYDVIHYHGHYPMVANYIPASTNFVQTRHDHSTYCANKYFFRLADMEVCRSFTPRDCGKYCLKSKVGSWGNDLNIRGFSNWRYDSSIGISIHKTIFTSENSTNLALKVLGINKRSTIHIVHNFIDTKVITSLIQKQVADNKVSFYKNKKVIIASTLVPPKGVYAFLIAYKNKGYNYPITVAGRGSELLIIRKEFKDYPVTLLGWLSHEDTLKLISSHQVFVITSLLEEPSTTTILEAMLLNKPVFALNRGGVPEMKVYSLYESQLNLYESMEKLVDGVANHLAAQPADNYIDYTNIDFGACVSKKALEIIKVYNA